ncbi:META domain-containing protein [Leptolyngbya ohadii]|uniref:META domain-containing protein n=1 Tax=Leptolyngbya ohadii TaxID=1962290 RepID=UPI000B59DF82|nr:META domain-containing protein [Leptolyngbya ohadii]
MIFQTRYSIGFTSLIAAAGAVVAGLSWMAPAIAQPQEQNSLLAETPVQMAQTSSLTGSWKLANMTAGNSPMPMLPASDTVPTAEFRDGRIAGSGGCNRFMGGYETEGNQLKIGPLASTFMACQPAVMSQESTYLKALQGAQRYEITDDGLTIFYETEEGEGVLRFVAQTTDETGSSSTSETVNETTSETVNETTRESESQPTRETTSPPADQPVRGLW